MRRRPQIAVAGVALALAVTAGCGGGETDSTDPEAQADVAQLKLRAPSQGSKREQLFCAPLSTGRSDDPAGDFARSAISSRLRSEQAQGGIDILTLVLATAPRPISAPASELAQAINAGRDGAGETALSDPEVEQAIAEINLWADANCPPLAQLPSKPRAPAPSRG